MEPKTTSGAILWFLGTLVIATLVGFIVNWWQELRAEKRMATAKAKADVIVTERDSATKEREELKDRIKDLERQSMEITQALALMNQQAVPLFEAAKIKLIETLTHPHPEFKIPDALLAIAKEDNIVTPELASILKERETSTNPAVTNEEKLAAAVLPKILEIAALEKRIVSTVLPKLQMVSIPGNEKKDDPEEKLTSEGKS